MAEGNIAIVNAYPPAFEGKPVDFVTCRATGKGITASVCLHCPMNKTGKETDYYGSKKYKNTSDVKIKLNGWMKCALDGDWEYNQGEWTCRQKI